MSFFSANPITEKLALAKRVTWEAVLTLAANTAPVYSCTSPASASAVSLQFASGGTTATGTLTGFAFTGLSNFAASNPENPVFACEVLDGLAKEFIGAFGIVTSTSGAANATVGYPVTTVAANGSVTSGHVVCTLSLAQTEIDATTGDTISNLAAATGTVKILLTVFYV